MADIHPQVPESLSIGMIFMSGSMHISGLMGSPRRTAGTTYLNDPTALSWLPLQKLTAMGGAILFIDAFLQIGIVLYLTFWAPKGEQAYPMGEVAEDAGETSGILEKWPIWVTVAVVLIVVAYGYPIMEMIQHPAPGAPGFKTW